MDVVEAKRRRKLANRVRQEIELSEQQYADKLMLLLVHYTRPIAAAAEDMDVSFFILCPFCALPLLLADVADM